MVKLMLNQWEEDQLELKSRRKGMLGVDAKFKEPKSP